MSMGWGVRLERALSVWIGGEGGGGEQSVVVLFRDGGRGVAEDEGCKGGKVYGRVAPVPSSQAPRASKQNFNGITSVTGLFNTVRG